VHGLDIRKIRAGEESPALLDILKAQASVLRSPRQVDRIMQVFNLAKLVAMRSPTSYPVNCPSPGDTFQAMPVLDGMGKQLDLGSYRERPMRPNFTLEASGRSKISQREMSGMPG
jgi:hypothetical protein